MKRKKSARALVVCLTFAWGLVAHSARVSSAQASPAHVLEGLELHSAGGTVEAVIRADGSMEHKVYVQDDPPQVVVDILNVRNPLRDQKPLAPHFLIELVRAEELPMVAYDSHDRDRTFGRITLILKEPVAPRVHAEERRLRLELIPKSSEAKAPTDGIRRDDLPAVPPTSAEQQDSAISLPPSVEIEPPDVDPLLFFATSASHADHYPLGPEDVIEVRVFELDQLNRTVRVEGNGTIDLPLIGSFPVAGLTSDEVSEEVAGRLRNRFVQNPQVSVFIQEFNSRKVSLLGSVKQPAAYPLEGRRNLLQLLADAGGLAADAGNLLYVFRQTEDGRSARLTVPLHELLIRGDPQWNIWLRAGDVISIPPEEAMSISVLGAVRQPGVHKLPIGQDGTLLKAIARAGGLTDRASKGGIQIKRLDRASGEDTLFKVDLGDILSGKKPDVVLQEGDVVVVKESFF